MIDTTEKHISILAVENATGATLFEAIDALDEANWVVEKACAIIFGRKLNGY